MSSLSLSTYPLFEIKDIFLYLAYCNIIPTEHLHTLDVMQNLVLHCRTRPRSVWHLQARIGRQRLSAPSIRGWAFRFGAQLDQLIFLKNSE